VPSANPPFMSPRAAAGQPAVPADRLERRRGPQRRLGRHHVDVPVEQQRRPGPRGEVPDHVGPARVRLLRYARDRVRRDVLRDGLDRGAEAQPVQLVADHLLRRHLGADRARGGDQPLQEREGVLGTVVDRPVEGARHGGIQADGGIGGTQHRPSKRLKVETLDLLVLKPVNPPPRCGSGPRRPRVGAEGGDHPLEGRHVRRGTAASPLMMPSSRQYRSARASVPASRWSSNCGRRWSPGVPGQHSVQHGRALAGPGHHPRARRRGPPAPGPGPRSRGSGPVPRPSPGPRPGPARPVRPSGGRGGGTPGSWTSSASSTHASTCSGDGSSGRSGVALRMRAASPGPGSRPANASSTKSSMIFLRFLRGQRGQLVHQGHLLGTWFPPRHPWPARPGAAGASGSARPTPPHGSRRPRPRWPAGPAPAAPRPVRGPARGASRPAPAGPWRPRRTAGGRGRSAGRGHRADVGPVPDGADRQPGALSQLPMVNIVVASSMPESLASPATGDASPFVGPPRAPHVPPGLPRGRGPASGRARLAGEPPAAGKEDQRQLPGVTLKDVRT